MLNLDFDAAVFDMDGTLLNTMPYWRFTALEYALARQWPVYADLVEKMYRTSSRKLVYEYAARQGVVPDHKEMVHELEGYMNRHYLCDAGLKDPDVPRFLERLRAYGIRMCVATGSPRAYACNGLRRLGLLDFFEFVTDNYEMPLTKDRPGYFDLLAERLGVEPGRCWVFEDALYAMKSARASGMRICAIEDDAQLADREAIRDLADLYIRRYAELMD